MKVKELIEKLKKTDPNSEAICGVYNGFVDTYGIVDYIWEDIYDHSVYNDLYGTPGQIDGRLMDKELRKDNQKVVYIGSDFPAQNGIGDKNIIKVVPMQISPTTLSSSITIVKAR
jgi:hypothetical protein